MAVTVVDSGSQTATLTTWHDVDTIVSTPGVYVFSVDMTNLANGETLDIRVKTNIRSVDAQVVEFQASYSHAQAEPGVKTPPVVVADDATFSIRQTGGTGRAFPWATLSL